MIRVFAPGIIRDNLMPAHLHLRNLVGDVRTTLDDPKPLDSYRQVSAQSVVGWEKSILQLCLYADEVFVPVFGTRSGLLWSSHYHVLGPEMRRARFVPEDFLPHNRARMDLPVHTTFTEISENDGMSIFRMFERLKPLLDANILRLYDPYAIFLEEISKTLLGEKRWMTREEIDEAWPDMFVAEGLMFAEYLGVPYSAITAEEISVLKSISKKVAEISDVEIEPVHLLANLELPGLDIDAETLVKVRMDEDAFASARKSLRQMSRLFASSLESYTYQRDVELFVHDVVLNELRVLREEVSKSKSLEDRIRPSAIDFAAGAFATTALTSNPLEGIAVGASTALARVVLQKILSQDEVRPEARYFQCIQVQGSPKASL